MKPRYKRRIVWSVISAVAAVLLAVIIIPSFITFDNLKPGIISTIKSQTGLDVEINGHVRLSLLGRARIMLHDVALREYENGYIKSVEFDLPISEIFNLKSARISNTLSLYGADLGLTSLITPRFDKRLEFYDSSVRFMGKRYKGISGVLQDGIFVGTVRTDQHKYNFDSQGNQFHISNQAEGLDIVGNTTIASDGTMSAVGTLTISTSDINRFFEFDVPTLPGRFDMTMSFVWTGSDFHFSNIAGKSGGASFTADISFNKLRKSISIVANGVDMDLSFIMQRPDFIQDSDFNIDIGGNLKFMDMEFGRVKLTTTSDMGEIDVSNLEFYSSEMSGKIFGKITGTDATLIAKIVTGDGEISCNFSGTPDNWSCRNWIYNSKDFSATGTLDMRPESFDMEFISNDIKPKLSHLDDLKRFLSRTKGNVKFNLAQDTIGSARFDGKKTDIEYSRKSNSRLADLPVKSDFFAFIPKSLLRTPGRLSHALYRDGVLLEMDFMGGIFPNNWILSLKENGDFTFDSHLLFLMSEYYPNVDFSFLNPAIFLSVVGKYKKPYVTDLKISSVFGDESAMLSGNFDGRTLSLRTNTLNMDELLNPEYVDNYESLQFIVPEPLFAPFMFHIPFVLSADYIKYDNQKYANFVYSLRNNTQQMSITDDERGNILMAVEKEKSKYNITLQVNKFILAGNVLNEAAPINLRDSTLTAQARLSTFGITSHDVWHNLGGDIDMTFDGGTLVGIGIDEFYNNLPNLSKLNVSDSVVQMLSGGSMAIRRLRISGKYNNEDFRTSQPFVLNSRNARIVGDIGILGGKIQADMNILMKDTSANPLPISLGITSDGARIYSTSDIFMSIDPDYMQKSNQ